MAWTPDKWGVTCELVAFGRGLGVPNTVKAKGGHREICGDQVFEFVSGVEGSGEAACLD